MLVWKRIDIHRWTCVAVLQDLYELENPNGWVLWVTLVRMLMFNVLMWCMKNQMWGRDYRQAAGVMRVHALHSAQHAPSPQRAACPAVRKVLLSLSPALPAALPPSLALLLSLLLPVSLALPPSLSFCPRSSSAPPSSHLVLPLSCSPSVSVCSVCPSVHAGLGSPHGVYMCFFAFLRCFEVIWNEKCSNNIKAYNGGSNITKCWHLFSVSV